MNILPIQIYQNFDRSNQSNNVKYRQNGLQHDAFQRSVSFGWCEPHQVRRTEVSQIFNETIRIKQKEAELKRKAGELLDIANRTALEATKFVINFANRMKGEAEFVPLWAIKTDETLQETLDASPIFGDPVQNLIGLKNIGKFKMNNPNYSEELNNQGAGSLQVHTAIIFTEQAERNLDKASLTEEDKKDVLELLQTVKNKIDEVFGKGTYAKLINISNMGANPTTEQKQESNRILKEIDAKARNFNFGDEFNHKVEVLVERLHIRFHHEHEHAHHHHEHIDVETPEVNIIYHTHGSNGEHVHEHEHEHVHEHI